MAASFVALAAGQSAWPQSADVSLRARVVLSAGRPRPLPSAFGGVVVWLAPLRPGALSNHPQGVQAFTIAQKNKQFSPHLLVVPTGSSVDFPNLDPFFHNVFSLFNGKRFDLGLYEAHSHRAVQFDREGVSYIFCNIHPEMGAVIIALSTPYYGISLPDGSIAIHNVPPGSYRLNVWAENVPVEVLNSLARTVEVSPGGAQVGEIVLQASGDMMGHHKNKFGDSYAPAAKDPY